MKILPFLLCCFLVVPRLAAQEHIYELGRGSIQFHSDAPQELIRASSDQLTGIVDIEKKSFVFRISIASFLGFNSPLQREHFNENYMETDIYPTAMFSGKIIEDVDFSKDGEFEVRAKGKLVIHGIAQQRIIKCHVSCKKGKVKVESDFIVLLADHNIKIPRIVYDKLSPEIQVSMIATLMPKK